MEKEEALVKIGLQIKKLREKKNIPQQDLAAACNFEKSNMSRIEAGRTNITISTLLKICEALKVEMKEVVDIK